jgi:hypothetical protein
MIRQSKKNGEVMATSPPRLPLRQGSRPSQKKAAHKS